MSKIKSIKWIYIISKRFNSVDSKGKASLTTKLSSIGIAFGVITLITIMSVMNGFQSQYIDTIMEISSYHLQATNPSKEFINWLEKEEKFVRTISPFYEAKGLLVESDLGRESPALIRAVKKSTKDEDSGFMSQLDLIAGDFDLTEENSIVLGSALARKLGAIPGSEINIMASSGNSSQPLFSSKRNFTVTGIFFTNYLDINTSFAFISIDDAKSKLGFDDSDITYGIKLNNSNKDIYFLSEIKKEFPEQKCGTWREYNRTFFGALKIEKNVLMLLVILIFLVVAVNIYNAMNRLIYERHQDIAVLQALGAKEKDLEAVFASKGFITGINGAVPGLVLGIVICKNIGKIFIALSKLQYLVQYAITFVFNHKDLAYIKENSMFSVFAQIPAKMEWKEITSIFLFGVFSALLSSIMAGKKIAKMNITEVLHDE